MIVHTYVFKSFKYYIVEVDCYLKLVCYLLNQHHCGSDLLHFRYSVKKVVNLSLNIVEILHIVKISVMQVMHDAPAILI